MMFFTGFTRFSSEIQKSNDIANPSKKDYLINMLALVDEAEKVLTDCSRNINDFGYLLNETWNLKRNTGSFVSNNHIDYLYNPD